MKHKFIKSRAFFIVLFHYKLFEIWSQRNKNVEIIFEFSEKISTFN